ncbi:heme-binding protein [Candidatus Pelagibacter sp.]|nr:heme-binding protein [Candidatus Pelagibacter sp.]
MIKLEKALSIANDCILIARENKAKPIAVVVLDKHGNTIVSLKEDDASFFRIDVAKGKAWGCVAMGESSRGLGDKAKSNPAFVNALTVTSKGRILPNPGAVLIKENNNVIGSVGISGDKGENDEKICIEAVKKNGLDTD